MYDLLSMYLSHQLEVTVYHSHSISLKESESQFRNQKSNNPKIKSFSCDRTNRTRSENSEIFTFLLLRVTIFYSRTSTI